MNAVYFNSANVSDLKKFSKDGNDMITYCSQKSTELIYEIIKPKQILFIGMDAPEWMKIEFDKKKNAVQSHKGNGVIWKTSNNNIPHHMIHHSARNYRYNIGVCLNLKMRYFEDNII